MAVDEEWMRARARSFSAAALVYERARPSYPPAALGWVLADQPMRVLDLGAGTGKLTRGLVALGHQVVAVEPLAQMRALLADAVPQAELVAGTAEELPLADGSVDAVVAGQAFHWFEPARALPEITRVLRPGGRLGLLWNILDDRVPWVARFADLSAAENRFSAAARRRDPPFPPGAAFETPVRRLVEHRVRCDVERLVGLVASHSQTILLDADERACLLERVRRLASTHPDLAGSATFELAYVTDVWRYTRREGSTDVAVEG